MMIYVPETKSKTPETMHELFVEPWCCAGSPTSGYQVIASGDGEEERVEPGNSRSSPKNGAPA